MDKAELIKIGFQYIRCGPSGQDMYAGMDIWKLPYANNSKYLVFRGHEKHLHSADNFNEQFQTIDEVKKFVFRKIKKII